MSKQQFDQSDYITVPERIAEFRAMYPTGSLQAADPLNPYRIERINDQTFIIYTAAAYRTPDDPRPGIGIAWEPVPGKTPFTRDSELMNAETSAWGRAIVGALAADTKRSVASAEEVRNRQADRDPAMQLPPVDGPISPENAERLRARCEEKGLLVAEVISRATDGRTTEPGEVLRSETQAVKQAMEDLAALAATA